MRGSCSSCKPTCSLLPQEHPRSSRTGALGQGQLPHGCWCCWVCSGSRAGVTQRGQRWAEPSSRGRAERDHFFWWQRRFSVPSKAEPQGYCTLSSGSSPTSKAIWIKGRMRWCPGDQGHTPLFSVALWGGDLACYYVRFNKSCITKLF